MDDWNKKSFLIYSVFIEGGQIQQIVFEDIKRHIGYMVRLHHRCWGGVILDNYLQEYHLFECMGIYEEIFFFSIIPKVNIFTLGKSVQLLSLSIQL